MVKLTYYGLGDAMIPEMCQEYKEKMCDKDHTYRVCWKMCHELTDIFREKEWISEAFGTYLMWLKQRRQKQYRRHYDWGRAMAKGTVLSGEPDHEPAEEKRNLEQLMKAYSEEMFMLWKLFCCAEEYCGLYEAAYMCALGIEEEEKNGIHPL